MRAIDRAAGARAGRGVGLTERAPDPRRPGGAQKEAGIRVNHAKRGKLM